jgi:hypothetical protein
MGIEIKGPEWFFAFVLSLFAFVLAPSSQGTTCDVPDVNGGVVWQENDPGKLRQGGRNSCLYVILVDTVAGHCGWPIVLFGRSRPSMGCVNCS